MIKVPNVAAFGLVGMGQLIMALNVLTGIFTTYAARDGVSLPTLQSTFLYVALAIVYLPIKYLIRKNTSLKVPLWYYLILGFVDVEGNYFAVKAFANANYVTCGLLLNLTVPFATAFCYLFLKTRYSWMHYIGSIVAIGGSIVIFATDYSSDLNGTVSKEVKGDFYCVIAAAFYATSNVMVQYVVKVSDMDSNIELLGFLGLFSSIVSAIQIAIFEITPIRETHFTGNVYWYFVGYVIALFTFYTIVSVFLRNGESLLFNLSLLTGPFFTFVVNYWLFDGIVKGWYWLALGLFYIGLIMYALSPPPVEPHSIQGKEKETIEIEGEGIKSPSTMKSPNAYASLA